MSLKKMQDLIQMPYDTSSMSVFELQLFKNLIAEVKSELSEVVEGGSIFERKMNLYINFLRVNYGSISEVDIIDEYRSVIQTIDKLESAIDSEPLDYMFKKLNTSEKHITEDNYNIYFMSKNQFLHYTDIISKFLKSYNDYKRLKNVFYIKDENPEFISKAKKMAKKYLDGGRDLTVDDIKDAIAVKYINDKYYVLYIDTEKSNGRLSFYYKITEFEFKCFCTHTQKRFFDIDDINYKKIWKKDIQKIFPEYFI